MTGRRPAAALILLVVGLVSTAVAAGLVWRAGVHDAEQRQQRELEVVASRAVARVGAVENQLRAVSALYTELPAGARRPGRTRYALKRLLGDPAVQGTAVAERVRGDERRAFERRVGAPVVRAVPGGIPVRSAERPEYVVLSDNAAPGVQPFEAFDLLQAPGRRPVIARALRGEAAITAPVTSLRTERPQVVVYVPVTTRGGKATDVMLTGSYDTTLLLRDLSSASAGVRSVAVRDRGMSLDGTQVGEGRRGTRRVAVLGRTWTVSAERPPTDRQTTLIVLLGGILTTLLAAVGARRLAGRQRRLRGQLAERELERDAATAQARAAERHAQFLAVNSQDMLTLHSESGEMLYVSPASSKLLGYEPEELIGRSPLDVAHPDDHAMITAFMAPQLTPDWHGQLTHRMIRRDGSCVWVDVQARAALDADGIVTTQASVRDVSARVAADATARSAEQRFRTAFDDAPIGMALAGIDGEVLQVNAALGRLIGLDAAQPMPAQLHDLLHPEDRPGLETGLQTLLTGAQTSHSAQLRLLDQSGGEVWCQLQTTLLLDDHGRPEHLLLQANDVSEQRRTEEQLRHLADHDPLTGLLNRRGFERALSERIRSVRRYHDGGALLMIDLDHFKAVNDTAGHSSGDQLLVATSRALAARLRGSDVLARLGGDEFAVLLPHADADQAQRVADALLQEVRDQAGAPSPRTSRSVTASIGITLLDAPAVTAEGAFAQADEALYDAKDAGRDRHHLHTHGHAATPA